MKVDYLRKLDKKIYDIVRIVGKEADAAEVKAYIVGGIVRDTVLGKQNFDLDIIVDSKLDIVVRNVSNKLKAKIRFFKQFKTAKIILPSGLIIDFATLRRETYNRSGALPVVAVGDLPEDLRRRDFTINTLAVSINKDSFGYIIDLFGGLNDLKNGVIKVLHRNSFKDDSTRILRAIRFEQRFNFAIDDDTLYLIKKSIEKKYAHKITPRRYFVELRKMLEEINPVKCFKRLLSLGGVGYVSKYLSIDLTDMDKIYMRSVRLFRKKEYKRFASRKWFFLFLSLIYKMKDKDIPKVALSFMLTKDDKVMVKQSLIYDELLKKISRKNIKRSEVFGVLRNINIEVLIFFYLVSDNDFMRRRISKFVEYDSLISVRISGKDVKRICGVQGKAVGDVLDDVLCHKINVGFDTKKEEIEYLKTLI